MKRNIWNEKDQIRITLNFESYVKGFIDCYAFIGIWPISISKLILENYRYRIDLILIRQWRISCLS